MKQFIRTKDGSIYKRVSDASGDSVQTLRRQLAYWLKKAFNEGDNAEEVSKRFFRMVKTYEIGEMTKEYEYEVAKVREFLRRPDINEYSKEFINDYLLNPLKDTKYYLKRCIEDLKKMAQELKVLYTKHSGDFRIIAPKLLTNGSRLERDYDDWIDAVRLFKSGAMDIDR